MWILRINTADRSYKFEDVPEEYKLLYGRALTLPRAGAKQQTGFFSGCGYGNDLADVRPDIGRGKIPIDGWHQGSECRHSLGAGPGKTQDPRIGP